MRLALVLALLLASTTTPFALAEPAAQELIVRVKGIVCSFCVNGLVTTLRKEKAVSQVNVDLSERKVRIYVKPGESLPDEKVRELVRDAGFETEGEIVRAR